MTNEQLKLKNELVNELLAKGFAINKETNDGNYVSMSIGNEFKITTTTYYNQFAGKEMEMEHINGYSLDVREVYHSNGADGNKSYRLAIVKWENNAGTTLEAVKISQKDGARKRKNAIEKIVKAYEEATKE